MNYAVQSMQAKMYACTLSRVVVLVYISVAIEDATNLIYDHVYYMVYSRSIADEHVLCHVSSDCDSHSLKMCRGFGR